MRISDWSSDVCSSDLGRSRLSVLSPHSCRSGSTLSRRSLPHARYRGDLFHPRHDLDFIDIVERDQLHAPRRFAHGDGRHWRHGVERAAIARSEEHTSELQSLMRNPYAVFCLNKTTYTT